MAFGRGFGRIHDLAQVEIEVRRDLQSAMHEITCAAALIEEKALLNTEEHEQLAEMINRARLAIEKVIG